MLFCRISPADLTGSLISRRCSYADFLVAIDMPGVGRLAVGRIMEVTRSGGRRMFFWAVGGAVLAQPLSGEEESLVKARLALRAARDALLARAHRGRRAGGLGRLGGFSTRRATYNPDRRFPPLAACRSPANS